MTDDQKTLSRAFGIGIAYPTRTRDGMITSMPDGKPNPRADSFNLYSNWVANKVLGQIFTPPTATEPLKSVGLNVQKPQTAGGARRETAQVERSSKSVSRKYSQI